MGFFCIISSGLRLFCTVMCPPHIHMYEIFLTQSKQINIYTLYCISCFNVSEGLGSKSNWSTILQDGCSKTILTGICLYDYRFCAVKVCECCVK